MAGLTDPIIGIENWKALAKDAPIDGIISLFEKSGNSFSLTLDETLKASKVLHVYFSLDSSEKIEFFVIPASSDVKGNKSIFSANFPISQIGTKQNLIANNTNNELVSWINNWCNEKLRNTWLMGLTQAVQVLVIHTTDFVVNDNHECYLALKQVNNDYTIDLVIQNTNTGDFINVKKPVEGDPEASEFADMARPVPPYDNDVGSITAESDFGILLGL